MGGKTIGLPPLPKLPNPSDTRIRARVIIIIPPSKVNVPAEVVGAGWGGVTTGRWVGGGTVRNVHGVCERCGSVRRAWDLIDKKGTFGRPEKRVCRSGCESNLKITRRELTVNKEE